ncbi:threonine aldolase family protein [Paenibacillus sp. S29]|uniref:threonine aldolase family protein n=1 Tax=Paenibacillus sp. S29 TaxID=3394611 RepID=UPI003BCE59EF
MKKLEGVRKLNNHKIEYVDLRSDTVTSPTQEMRQEIYMARVGDHGYGEDETTIELEQYCARLFGKEAALFMPSGTMSDQVSIRCWTESGDEVILDRSYHINYFQAGPSTDLGKILLHTCETEDGVLGVEQIDNAITQRIRGNLFSRPALISLENTINGHGGRIFPIEALKDVYSYAQAKGIPVHIDGERFLNACVATNIPVNEYASFSDSISCSFSKGLGAPFGSIIMGKSEFIEKAKKYRRWYGGSLHQSGFMAGAALYAITNNISRLKEDHDHAKLLATLIQSNCECELDIEPPETNMIMLDTRKLGIKAVNFAEKCKEMGVLVYPWAPYTIRAVTHLDINTEKIRLASNVIANLCSQAMQHSQTERRLQGVEL